MINAIQKFFRNLQAKSVVAAQSAKASLADERGDTNFISIAIILIVVITVAVVFIGFKDTILAAFNDAVNQLKAALGI